MHSIRAEGVMHCDVIARVVEVCECADRERCKVKIPKGA